MNPNPDLIDIFLVNLNPADLGPECSLPSLEFIGQYRIASIGLSFLLECAPGYTGNDCRRIPPCNSSPCKNNGVCRNLPDSTGFTCRCVGDFRGTTCQNRINDCAGVNCNNGRCEDGVRSFVCECNDGYMGRFCNEIVITTPPMTTEVFGEGPSPGATGAGGFVGGVVATLFVVAIIARIRRRRGKGKGESSV